MATTYQHWRLDKDQEGFLWLTIDRHKASVNSLNQAVLTEFDQILDGIAEQDAKGLVIRSGKKTGFIAGADIEQFTHLKDSKQALALIRQAQLVFDKLAALKMPTVAMIEGFCLGGGFELALACDYRVALDDPKTKLGLPEVMLGIHPGWGGTVRLPSLIGVVKSMGAILSGRLYSPRAAAKLGMVDAAVPRRVFRSATTFYLHNKPRKHTAPWWDSIISQAWLRPWVARLFYGQLEKKVKKAHYPAPYAVIKNWVHDGASGSKAMRHEAESIAKLLVTDTSRNLVRVFFLQNRLKALGRASDFRVQRVHVIGAGTMGGDIAAWCALRGLRVSLQDQSPERIGPAVKRAVALFHKKLKKDKAAIQAAKDRLMPDVQGLGVSRADVVIEAIFENLEAKQALYKKLEPQMKADAILATNTSSLPLDELNTVLKNPERLVGIHFFNPVAKMQLVEVVKGNKTSADVFANAQTFVGRIGRLPLPVNSSPGFLINRILMPYLLEAMRLFEAGVPATVIDKTAKDFGMPMGPVELADKVGLDICLSVAEILTQHFGGEVPARLRSLVEAGHLGVKSGQGFYRYRNGKPVAGMVKDAHLPEDIADRLILVMLNEAVACLRVKVLDDADLLDVGMIFGTGFAPFRGGPIHYAKQRGVFSIVQGLHVLEQQYGKQFAADAGWDALKPKEKPPKAPQPKPAAQQATTTAPTEVK